MGSLRQSPYTRIEDLTFRVYTDEEIEKISAVNITNDESLNALGHCLENGIYDLRMGPMFMFDDDLCKTCGNRFRFCSGHYGHISLPLPVCNPFFISIIRQLLGRICDTCFRFQVKAHRGIQYLYECKLFMDGYHLEALEVANIVSSYMTSEYSDEAVEVSSVMDKKGSMSAADALKRVFGMQEKLKKACKKIKKESTPSTNTTCNSQAIYTQLQKRFLEDTKVKGKGNCIYCKNQLMVLKFQNSQILIKNSMRNCKVDKAGKEGTDESLVKDFQPYLTAKQAQEILQKCFKLDGYVIKYLYPFLSKFDHLEHPTNIFFIKSLLVIPPRLRPCIKMNGGLVEKDISVLYKFVMRLSKCLRFMVQNMDKGETELPERLALLVKEFSGSTMLQKSHSVWYELQSAIDNIFDAEMNKSTRLTTKGIRQVIEKKFGLFRRNLMGKRVDFSARSVAAPDAMLAVDEVGVPLDFALRLSYPVPVTPWNVPKLRKLVQNGAMTYPGALMVEDEEGRKVSLKSKTTSQRRAIADSLLTPLESCVRRVNAAKVVYRHLQSGDYVLMNRQPTLHKPSIQAHRARVMPHDRVLRLPYASCKAYNADFDGDELNLHFPQNEMARSEALHLINSRNQYLTPKDGSPLAGLIQDCVVAGVMLTVRGKFFPLEDYQQLVYVAVGHLPSRIRLLPPAILKPRRMWSGKQVISTILLNVIPEGKGRPSFVFKTTVKVDLWQNALPTSWKCGGLPERTKEGMTESEFVMRDGELVCGVLDKCAIGSTSYGLVHTCYDLYGGGVASDILTAISRLCVTYLQWTGHTISLKEFVTSPSVASRRRKELQKLIVRSESEVKAKLGFPQEKSLADHFEFVHKSGNEVEMAAIDAAYTAVLGPATSTVIRENELGLYRNNLENKMRMMVDTGAKGSKINMNQMASLFGSVAIDGKRMPLSLTGKTLPSFKPYECNPCAGGYIPDRFVTGMDPKSYFFLCIVGRDSLQHTAVKTANSGYMQRCLIKHLEGINVKYDRTVRNSDGVVLQFLYGEDGLDASKVPFLKNTDTIDGLLDNYIKSVDPKDLNIATASKLPDMIKMKRWTKKYREESAKKIRRSPFLRFCEEQGGARHCVKTEHQLPGRSQTDVQLVNTWAHASEERKAAYRSKEEKLNRGRDPLSMVFSGVCHFGVVSEAMDSLIEKYYEEKYSRRRSEEQELSREEVVDALHMKALHSSVDPGEAVGALCAQAIGEPLTQMTLNTFHFAGRDELNVTLGVPRMIEILRSASEKINTPIMEVPFKIGVKPKIAEKIRVALTPVPLAKVLKTVEITTSLEHTGKLLRRTEILFHLLPKKEYRKVFAIKPKGIVQFIEKSFIKNVLIREIKGSINQVNLAGAAFASSEKTQKKGEGEEGDGDPQDEPSAAPQKWGMDEDGGSSSEDEGPQQDGDDGMASTAREQKKKERDYSEDEEEEEDIEESAAHKKKKKSLLKGNKGGIDNPDGDNTQRDEQEEDDQGQEMFENEPSLDLMKNVDYISQKNFIIGQNPWIIDYDFDRTDYLWCKVTLDLPVAEGRYDLVSILQKTADRTLVHCVRGIKKAFVVPKDDHLLLRTEGVNIKEMYSFEHLLDINQIYTNNIHQMAKIYGIEAAQRCIIKEIRQVQSAYDIKVDFRHLSLLADYFTCQGVYKACSRHAINNCASPIQSMSYETCMEFLRKALLQAVAMVPPEGEVAFAQTRD